MVFDTLLNCEGCLIRSSETEPQPHFTASWQQSWWSYSNKQTRQVSYFPLTKLPIRSIVVYCDLQTSVAYSVIMANNW